ncbi:MAG: hypothetical protein GC160_23825 [Acidobacteria bacterium]|nr:hypothetical protein [Acidobacteriota bacterium]
MNEAANTAAPETRIVYCRCAYARVVPREVKDAVLESLSASNLDFDAAPDLCEMSARKDERLREIAAQPSATIVACYPRAVRWLFSGAGFPLDPEKVRILNMREEPAEAIVREILPLAETQQ